MPQELSPDSKFTLSLQTLIYAGVAISSLAGMWFALQADIQEAKELPTLESLYESEYPSKPQGYNHPASFEQYKSQVGGLQEDADDLFQTIEEMQEEIDELNKRVMELRIKAK